jgi:ketosteroid isomerase-like protein
MEETMSHTRLHELISAFEDAVAVFNAKGDLGDYFHDHVILVKAEHPAPIFGRAAVQADFNQRYQYPVGFTPTSVDAVVSPVVQKMFGVVDGSANWVSKHPPHPVLPILYVFIFQKDEQSGKWRIRTLWGSPSH